MILAVLAKVLVSAVATAPLVQERSDPVPRAVAVATEDPDRARAAALVAGAQRALALENDPVRVVVMLAELEPLLFGSAPLPGRDALTAEARAIASRIAGSAEARAALSAAELATLARFGAAVPDPLTPSESAALRPDGSPVAAIAAEALRRRDYAALMRLGAHSVPAVEALLEADPTANSEAALEYLLAFTPRDGALAVQRLLRRGSVPPRKVADVLLAAVLRKDESWFSLSTEPPQRYAFVVAEFVPLVEELLEAPAATESGVTWVEPILQRDALTGRMVELLGAMLASSDLATAQRAFRLAESSGRYRGVVPLLLHGLESLHDLIRLRSIEALRQHEFVPEVLAAAEDASPEVRLALAGSLQEGVVTVSLEHITTNGTRAPHVVTRSGVGRAYPEEARRAFELLLRDSDERVRRAALARAPTSPSLAVPGEAFVEIARRGSSEERRVLLGRALPGELASRVLAEAARDTAPEVQQMVDAALLKRRPADVLSVLAGRWKSVLQRGNDDWRVARALLDHAPAIHSLMTWIVEEGDAGDLIALEDFFFVEGLNFLEFPRAVPDPLYAAWIAKLARTPHANARVQHPAKALLEALAESRSERLGAFKLAFADTALPFDLRLVAAQACAKRADPAFVEILADLLAGASGVPTAEDDKALRNVVGALAPGSRNATVARLVADAAIPSAWAGPLVADLRPGDEGWEPVVQASFERWGSGAERFPPALRPVLRAALGAPAMVPHELLRLAVRDEVVWNTALPMLAARRSPADVPLLAECLRGEGFGIHYRTSMGASAANALFAIGDQAAVEALLAGLSHDDKSVRQACAEALDQLEAAEVRRARWRARAAASGTLDVALADLRPLLEHTDVAIRAEAVRSLGTLGSPLDIPRLVPLLADEEPRVREAARAALDRLHAIEAPAPKIAAPAPTSNE